MLFVVFLVMFIVVVLISWSWTNGIDYMKENHPDYTGDDFLNWDSDVTKTAGRDAWDLYDEDCIHTEGEI